MKKYQKILFGFAVGLIGLFEFYTLIPERTLEGVVKREFGTALKTFKPDEILFGDINYGFVLKTKIGTYKLNVINPAYELILKNKEIYDLTLANSYNKKMITLAKGMKKGDKLKIIPKFGTEIYADNTGRITMDSIENVK